MNQMIVSQEPRDIHKTFFVVCIGMFLKCDDDEMSMMCFFVSSLNSV
jgi:hypothetical protein